MIPTKPDVNQTQEATFLGTTIDSNLSCGHNMSTLSYKKQNSSIFVINRIFNIIVAKSAATAYHSLFASCIRYGRVVCGGTSATKLQKILLQ